MTLFGRKGVVDKGCILKGSDFCKLLLHRCLSLLHRGNDINLCFLLYGCGIDDDSSVPFLTFNQFIKTHKLNPSQYNNPLTEDRKVIHNEVFRLYNKGLGYKRIHRKMVENGFDVAKSSTAIDSIIKKRLKREAFLNQPITNEYSNYDI